MSDFAVVVSSLMPCPACGSTATVQAVVHDDAPPPEPEPGDLVICIGCEAICILTGALRLRLFVLADLEYYTLDDLACVARAVKELRATYQRRN